MKEPLREKIRISIRKFISKITHHEHGCCDDVFRNCSKCIKLK